LAIAGEEKMMKKRISLIFFTWLTMAAVGRAKNKEVKAKQYKALHGKINKY